MMLLVWLHAYNSGTIVEILPGVKVYWIALGVIMLLVVVARIAFQFGFFKLKAKVLSHKVVASDIFELHVQLPGELSTWAVYLSSS